MQDLPSAGTGRLARYLLDGIGYMLTTIRGIIHPNDYHFSTETIKLSTGAMVWTEKVGYKYPIRFGNSVSIGEYYINTAPRTVP